MDHLPYALIINFLMFGSCAYSSHPLFFSLFVVSLCYFFLIYTAFGMVAMQVKNDFLLMVNCSGALALCWCCLPL